MISAMESKGPPGWDEPVKPSRRPSVVPLMMLLALALAGAGLLSQLVDGGNAEEEVEKVVVYAISTADPAMCTEVFTERWLETHFSSPSEDPVSRCREANAEPASKALSTTVESVSVSGSRAEVSVSAEGGNFGSGSFELVLVEEDGWRLDELTGLQVDVAAYFQAQRAELSAASSVPPEARALMECSLDWAVQNVSAGEIERTTLSGDGYAYLAGSYESCSAEFEAAVFDASLISGESGLSKKQAACFVSALKAALSEDDRERFYAAMVGRESFPPDIDAKRDEAGALCAGAGSNPAAPA